MSAHRSYHGNKIMVIITITLASLRENTHFASNIIYEESYEEHPVPDLETRNSVWFFLSVFKLHAFFVVEKGKKNIKHFRVVSPGSKPRWRGVSF